MFTPDYTQLLKEYEVTVTELPEAIQQKIILFEQKLKEPGITDDELENLDSGIFGDIQDWLAQQESEEVPAPAASIPSSEPTPPAGGTTSTSAPASTQTKEINPASYPTATQTKKPESTKSKGFFDTLFGD